MSPRQGYWALPSGGNCYNRPETTHSLLHTPLSSLKTLLGPWDGKLATFKYVVVGVWLWCGGILVQAIMMFKLVTVMIYRAMVHHPSEAGAGLG